MPVQKNQSVIQWAQTARLGERIVYATRHVQERDPRPGHAMAEARAAHDAGLVFLAQRRRRGGWDYEATRVSVLTARVLGIHSNRKEWEHGL